jgi:hypothetical protein
MNTAEHLRTVEPTPETKKDGGWRSDQYCKCTHKEIIRLATFASHGGNAQTRVSLSEHTLPDGKTSQCILHQGWTLKDGQWVPCCKKCLVLPPDARPIAPSE